MVNAPARQSRPILLMDEQSPACPECGRRMEVSEMPVASDADGEIHVATCIMHGTWRVQDDPEEHEQA